MEKCELCKKVARMYCDSDKASLCWDCDYRVHTANFLVAKHTRTLLCHGCQSPTSWTGSGSKLGPTFSVCEACVDGRSANINGDHDPQNGNTDDDVDGEDEDEDEEDEHNSTDDDDNDNDGQEDDDDRENQVVPLSPPRSLASTSSRISCNGTGMSRENNGNQNIRSWTWR